MNRANLPRALAVAAAGVALATTAARAEGPVPAAPRAPSAPSAPAPPPRPTLEAASQLDGDAASVQGLLRTARAAKKTDAVACLDRALSRLHAAARAARELPAGDAEQEQARAQVLRQRGKTLVLQAKRCVEATDAPAGPPRSPDGVVVVRVPDLPEP